MAGEKPLKKTGGGLSVSMVLSFLLLVGVFAGFVLVLRGGETHLVSGWLKHHRNIHQVSPLTKVSENPRGQKIWPSMYKNNKKSSGG